MQRLQIQVLTSLRISSLKADLPTAIGLVKDLDADVEMSSSELSQKLTTEKKYYIDTVNIKVPRKNMELVSFLRDGMSEWVPRFSKLTQLFILLSSGIYHRNSWLP